jgi:hypothetical protein
LDPRQTNLEIGDLVAVTVATDEGGDPISVPAQLAGNTRELGFSDELERFVGSSAEDRVDCR